MKRAYYFFKQTILKNRLAHLYLISGPRGSGKSQLIDEVSYLILNKDKPESPHFKLQIKERKISNMMVIEPDGLTIKKEQILALQAEFSKSSLVSGPRIYVIKNIEKISSAAANSLLKFMEEPVSKHVYGFLLTENIDEVIRTIISRSQVLHLKGIDEKDLEKELLELGVEEKIATLVPYITKDIVEATKLAEDPNFRALIDFIEEFIKNFNKKEISFPLLFASKASFITQDRDFFKSFLELLLLYFLDLLHYKAHQTITFVFLKEYIQIHSDQMDVKTINEIISKIQDVLEKQTYFINLDLAMDDLSYYLEKKR